MERSQLINVIWIILLYLKCRPNDSARVKLTNANCSSLNQSWVTINQCRLKAISRNKTIFNFNASVLHPATNFWIRYKMLKRESGYKPWLFNRQTVDCCRFFKKPYNLFGVYMYTQFKDFLNIKSCPISGDIIIQGMYLRTELITLPMPTGEFLLSSMFIFHHKPQLEINVTFAFDETLI